MHSSNVTALWSLLLLTLGVQSASVSVEHEVQTILGEDAVLHCLARTEPGVHYKSVTWYKVNESSSRKLTGLVKKLTQNNSTIQRYKGLTRDVELLEDSHGLVLPNVTLQDVGRYLCFRSAPLGHQNQEGEIHLKVNEWHKPEHTKMELQGREYEEHDTLYMVLAILLLAVALMMLYVSYNCLRNTLISHKEKFSKHTQLNLIQKKKHCIVSLESKGVVSKLLHQEYV